MISTRFLDDGTEYAENNVVDEGYTVEIGDELVFFALTDRFPEINKKVVTVSHISFTGGIAVAEYRENFHFNRNRFHRVICGPKEEERGREFDEVFA